MKNNLLSEKLIYTGESLTPTHLHLCTYNATEIQESSSDTFQAIKGTLNNDQINWLQIHGMKNTETIREICSHFEIDFLVLQDILNADHPTKIEEHDKYIVLILKIFYPNEHKEEDELDELAAAFLPVPARPDRHCPAAQAVPPPMRVAPHTAQCRAAPE